MEKNPFQKSIFESFLQLPMLFLQLFRPKTEHFDMTNETSFSDQDSAIVLRRLTFYQQTADNFLFSSRSGK